MGAIGAQLSGAWPYLPIPQPGVSSASPHEPTGHQGRYLQPWTRMDVWSLLVTNHRCAAGPHQANKRSAEPTPSLCAGAPTKLCTATGRSRHQHLLRQAARSWPGFVQDPCEPGRGSGRRRLLNRAQACNSRTSWSRTCLFEPHMLTRALCRDPCQPVATLQALGQAWTLDLAWAPEALLAAEDDGSVQQLSLVPDPGTGRVVNSSYQ